MLDLANRIAASVEIFYSSARGNEISSGDKLPMADCVESILNAGFGAEMLLADHWNSHSPVSESTVTRLEKLCKEADPVTIHSCVGKWDPEALRKEVLTARRIGVPQIVIHPYALGLDLPNHTPVHSDIRDLCKFALDNGVHFALENLGRTGITSLRRALDIVGSDPDSTGLGICIDTGHAHRSCTSDGIRPEAFIQEFRNLILEMHIDDNLGDADLHLPPGKGTIEWQPVMSEMSQLRENTIICLELASSTDPIATLNESRVLMFRDFDYEKS